jgi:hypothetical protein
MDNALRLAGIAGMIVSIAIVFYLILPASGSPAKALVCLGIGVILGLLSLMPVTRRQQ